ANKKVQGFFWFEQPTGHNQKPVQHNSPQTAQLAERVAGWNVVYSVVEEELRRQNHLPSTLLCVWVRRQRNAWPREPKSRAAPLSPSKKRTRLWRTSSGVSWNYEDFC
ncbi:uncharacterized protein LACBIDRAFT_174460, partial [Laccaria bicolor S238N-H82]